MTDASKMPREEIEALLIFLANGTLEGDERREVEEAVAEDADLQNQLQALKAIRKTMQEEQVVAPPGEFGLARLKRDITAEETAPETANQQSAPNYWRIAAVVAFALVLAQATYFGLQSGSDVTLAGGEGSYDPELAILVAFNPDASEADIRATLLEFGLVIVDGPSALGLYTLAAEDEIAKGAALNALQDVPAIVESAE